MSRFLLAVVLLTFWAGLVRPDEPAAKGALVVGKNIPAPFAPFNVTGASRGQYHCLVSEYNADPVVLLFVRKLDDNAAFRELLTQLDQAIERNARVRLRGFVVFLDDDLKDPLLDDDKRDEYAQTLEKLAADLKLTKLILTIGSQAKLAKYELDPNAALTAVLYRKHDIVAVHTATADKVNEALVKTITGQVSSLLGATR
jgi:hypothetical protein